MARTVIAGGLMRKRATVRNSSIQAARATPIISNRTKSVKIIAVMPEVSLFVQRSQ